MIWMGFVQEKSNGFTKKGALLLQEAVESHVYAVLGAQARTPTTTRTSTRKIKDELLL